MRASPFLLALAVLLAGCQSAGEPAPSACAPLPNHGTGLVMMADDAGWLALDASVPWDFVTLWHGFPHSANHTWFAPTLPPSWSSQAVPLGGSGASGLAALRVTPGASAGAGGFGLHWEQRWPSGEGCTTSTPYNYAAELDVQAGEEVQAGAGVLVELAAFWTNGTMFATNMEWLHASDVPRAGWYAWTGTQPLQAYVYEDDPSEQPAEWKGLAGAVPPGSPVWPVAAAADATLGLAYVPTIRGLNEALKGTTTATQRAVLVAPEDAYTQPGLEKHPLYGDALVFVVRPVRVDRIPCAACPPPPV